MAENGGVVEVSNCFIIIIIAVVLYSAPPRSGLSTKDRSQPNPDQTGQSEGQRKTGQSDLMPPEVQFQRMNGADA